MRFSFALTNAVTVVILLAGIAQSVPLPITAPEALSVRSSKNGSEQSATPASSGRNSDTSSSSSNASPYPTLEKREISSVGTRPASPAGPRPQLRENSTGRPLPEVPSDTSSSPQSPSGGISRSTSPRRLPSLPTDSDSSSSTSNLLRSSTGSKIVDENVPPSEPPKTSGGNAQRDTSLKRRKRVQKKSSGDANGEGPPFKKSRLERNPYVSPASTRSTLSSVTNESSAARQGSIPDAEDLAFLDKVPNPWLNTPRQQAVHA